jgi:hypothetical protein
MPPKHPAEGPEFLAPRSAKPPRKEDENISKALVPRDTKSSELHPSTSRALVLRRAAYGSGELAVSRKISGQEKLSLLAGELLESFLNVLGPLLSLR